MSTKKITALTVLSTTPASGDLLPIVDISDTTDASSGTTKSITAATIHKAAGIGAGNTTAEPVKVDTSNGRLGVGTNAPGSVCEIAAAGVPFEVNSTDSNANKITLADNGTARGYIGATSTLPFIASDSSGNHVFSIGPQKGINQKAYASYDDDDEHSIVAIIGLGGCIRITESVGSIQIPYYSVGGTGVGYKAAMLETDASTPAFHLMGNATTYSVTNPGTSGNTYEIKHNQSNGEFSVHRTSGALAYTVTVASWWYS